MSRRPVVLRGLTAADAAEAAILHRRAFPDFFLSSLGESFLRQFYTGFAGDPAAVTVVARDHSGVLVGAAVGSLEPAGFFTRLLRRRLAGFVLASAVAALRRPTTVPRLLAAVRYRGVVPNAPAGAALLSSICVAPEARGTGVGRLLLSAWASECARRGAPAAYLTTDAESNEATNTFYRSGGWSVTGTTKTPQGRVMNCYVIELSPEGTSDDEH